LTNAVGASLRAARLDAGFSLEQLARRSGGRYKPSSLGGYERGERTISIPRFCDLAELLGVPADQLLSRALRYLDPEKHGEVMIDLGRLPDSAAGRRVAEYAHTVKSMRGDFLSDVLTLRAGDLRVIARTSAMPMRRLVSNLGQAIRRVGPGTEGAKMTRSISPLDRTESTKVEHSRLRRRA
jgi:transcriptional regulator with XRE-family HTH domain